MGGKHETLIIYPEVISPPGFVRLWILFKDKFHLWDCPTNLLQHMDEEQLGIMWSDVVDITTDRILQVGLEGTLQTKGR